eukprot:COSAG02_NODE_686_length_18484_cov_29.523851_14_plen_227_part_00
MVRLAEEGRVLWTQEQARAREPKPKPASAPEPEPEPAPVSEATLEASSRPQASSGADSLEPPRLNANAPVFFTPVYTAPTHMANIMGAAAPQFTPLNSNFGYAPPMPGSSPHAQFPMGPVMMDPMMHSAGGHSQGKRNGRGQKKIGRNRGGGGAGGGGAGRGRGRGGGSGSGRGSGGGSGEGNIASIVAGLVGKLDAGTVVGTAVGDKTNGGKGAATAAGSASTQQ